MQLHATYAITYATYATYAITTYELHEQKWDGEARRELMAFLARRDWYLDY